MADTTRQFPLTRYFHILQLPSLVFYTIAEYLSPREKGILSQVNKHVRNLLNSSQLTWKDINFVISPTRQNQCKHVVELLRERNATSLSFRTVRSAQIQEAILQAFPNLQSLSIPMVSASTPKLIAKFCKNLKKLHIWKLTNQWYSQDIPLEVGEAISEMANLEDLCLEGDVIDSDRFPKYTENLKAGICYHHSLTRLEFHFEVMEIPWLLEICCFNPKLRSLKVHSTRRIQGFILPLSYYRNDFAWLKDFALEEISIQGPMLPKDPLDCVIDSFDECQSLISLDFSYCERETILRKILRNLYKLPSLRQLNLTKCSIKNDMFLANHPRLHHLELRSCSAIKYDGIKSISTAMSSSLKYFGLANCYHIQETDIKRLPSLFPSIDTIDLSGCNNLNDKVLIEIYLQPTKPKLCPRKIVAKGCKNLSKEIVELARKKLCNKLIFEIE